MTKILKTAILGTALAAFILPASAQSTSDKKWHASVPRRKLMQQERIGNGVKSGQLTAGETRNLERKEAKLNKETHEMREDNGGKLTPAERAKVNRQQNQLSRQIYRDKHNNKVR